MGGVAGLSAGAAVGQVVDGVALGGIAGGGQAFRQAVQAQRVEQAGDSLTPRLPYILTPRPPLHAMERGSLGGRSDRLSGV
jgi:hypothetical protein